MNNIGYIALTGIAAIAIFAMVVQYNDSKAAWKCHYEKHGLKKPQHHSNPYINRALSMLIIRHGNAGHAQKFLHPLFPFAAK